MKLTVKHAIPKTDLLLVLVPEKNTKKAFGKLLSPTQVKELEGLISDTRFNAHRGECMSLHFKGTSAKRVLLVGMGEIKKPVDYHECVAAAVRKARKLKVKHPVVLLPKEIDLPRAVSGAYKGDYTFKIGDLKDHHEFKGITLVSERKEEYSRDIVLGECVEVVKDLVNYPANYMSPIALTKEAQLMGKKVKGLKVSVLTAKQMNKLGMGALLNVGKGSAEESRMIIMEYYGTKKKERPIALVGKGVTFDSGGYNIKPTRHIEDMKCDMAGAATVMGLMQYFARTKIKHNFIGVVGAVENLVSHEAYKPGDIVTAMNKKTIEIGNTDAEGRLVLADALHYTEKKYKPAVMIDFATLTGSCMMSLGYTMSGVMGNDQPLIEHLKKSAIEADEEIWQLPLNDYFVEKTKGHISDLTNVTDGVLAGASMAAAFLSNFVDHDKTRWAHFDIAGTAFHGKGQSGGKKLATGVLMRTVIEWAESL